jgi:uncharacterized membrane protein YphA (DoxX/SURF4 family)
MKRLSNLLFGEHRPAAFQIIWLLFRLHAGLSIAIGAGYSKLAMPEWFTQQVGDIGFTFPSPFFWAWLAIWGEFMGGLLIAFGLFTRLAAFQLAFQFFVISFVWYEAPEPITGMYYQQLFFWVFVLITVAGGERFSLDALIFRHLKSKKLGVAMTVGLLLLLANPSVAQNSRIDGNGQITTAIRIVDEFHAIHVEDYCNVEVTCGQMVKVLNNKGETLVTINATDDGKMLTLF